MNEVQRLVEVLEGYVDLGTQLLKNWTPYVQGVSAKVDAGTYQASDVANDFPTVAALTAKSWVLIGSEALDALAILTEDFSEKEVVKGYQTPAAGTHRTLAFKDDLQSFTTLKLPASRVKIVPAKLGPNERDFLLAFDGDGFKARTYDGHVVVTGEDGHVDEVFVSVTIG